MARRYPKEVHEFIRENYLGISCEELTCRLNRRFPEYGFTIPIVKVYKSNHKLRSGTHNDGKKRMLLSDKEISFMTENLKGTHNKDLADMVNARFGRSLTTEQIRTFKNNHGLNSGLTGRFEKGHVPANKGKTWDEIMKSPESRARARANTFRKGHVPHTYLPVGSEVVKSDGYLWRKIAEPNRWRQVHRLLWEELNGPVPEGMKLIFLNGDRTDIRIDNLKLVSNEANLEMTRKGLRFRNPTLTEAGAEIANLNVAISKARRKER